MADASASPRRTCLITGASSGIGRAFADVFADEGFDLVLTARRTDKLNEAKAIIEQRAGVNVTVIPSDLADPDAPQKLYDEITAKGITIDALVNNAGYGVPGFYQTTDWKTQADFLQVLVTSVAHLCHLFLPGMLERGYGRIINVASLNGLIPGSPGQTLYSGAKSFVVQLSQTLAQENEGTGVQVTALCPGFTYSEFHDVTGTRDLVSQRGKLWWSDAETVARLGYEGVMKADPVVVTGTMSKVAAGLAKYLPSRMAFRFFGNQSKSVRKKQAG